MKYNSPITSNGDAPVSREVAFEPVEPKAWQPKLFRPRHNVEPGQHSGGLLDIFHDRRSSAVHHRFAGILRDEADGGFQAQCLAGTAAEVCRDGQASPPARVDNASFPCKLYI